MIPPPKRWLDSELPEELSAALASADSDGSEIAIDRVRARLGAALGPAFGVEAQTPAPAPRAAKVLLRGKGLGLGAILSIGIAFLWIARPETDAGAVTSRHQSPSTKLAEVQETQPLPVEMPAPAEQPLAAEEPPSAAVEPSAAVVPARSAKRAQAEPGLAEELRALAQIKQDVSTAPRRALAEADAHARRFPHGTLGPERQLLRIEALLRLGRDAEAHKLAQRELTAPGGHPYRVRIEQLLTRAR